jgi:septal ring factor EnvC (AmiA/AmiB activator)
MGIMILIVLILALEMIAETAVDIVAHEPDLSSLEDEITTLEARHGRLTQELQSLDNNDIKPKMSPLERARALQTVQHHSKQVAGDLEQANRRLAELPKLIEKKEHAIVAKKEMLSNLAQSLTNAQEDAHRKAMRNVAFIPDERTRKTAHLVECSSDAVRVVSLGAPPRNQEWPVEGAIEQFDRLLRASSTSSEYFVFMLKPSGVSIGMKLYYAAEYRGFEAGYDALEENAKVSEGDS